MFKHSVFRLFPIFVFSISLTLSAAERQPAPLPEGVVIHASVQSPIRLLEDLDKAVSAVTDGTQHAIPPGLLPMLFQIYMPFPIGAWDMEQQADFFMFENDAVAVLVHADGPDAVTKDFDDEGLAVEIDAESGYRFVESKALDAGGIYFADVGDGRVLFADNSSTLDHLLVMLKEWKPVFWGEGIATVNIALPPNWGDAYFRDVRRAIGQIPLLRQDGGKEIRKVEQFGVKAEVVDALLGLMENHLPSMLDEIGGLENIAFDLRLDDDRIGLATRLGFPEGSFADSIAVSAAARPNPDSAIAKYVGSDAAGLILTAPPADLVPGLYARLRGFIETLYGEVYPDQKDAVLGIYDQYAAAGARESVVASYLFPDGQYNVTWTKADDAGKFLDIFPKAVDSVNAVLDKTITNPSFRFSLSCDKKKTAAGIEYFEVVLIPEKPDDVEQILHALEALGQTNVNAFRQLLDFKQLVTVKDDTIVAAAGDVDEEQLIAALSDMEEIDDRFIDGDEAQEALGDIRRRQNVLGLIDFDSMMLYMAKEMCETYDQAMGTDTFIGALDDALPGILLSNEVVGMGLGAAGALPLIDISVPLFSINTAIRNYEHYIATLTGQLEGPGDDEDGDRKEDEYFEHEEDDDTPFDGLIDAS